MLSTIAIGSPPSRASSICIPAGCGADNCLLVRSIQLLADNRRPARLQPDGARVGTVRPRHFLDSHHHDSALETRPLCAGNCTPLLSWLTMWTAPPNSHPHLHWIVVLACQKSDP